MAAMVASVAMATVVAIDGPSSWTATRHGEVVASLRAVVRPDMRCYLLIRSHDDDAYGRLLDAALDALDGDLYIEVDEADTDTLRLLTARGFRPNRREHHYVVPTHPVSTSRARHAMPERFGILSAADAQVDGLRQLDDALRQEVPGASGWRNDPDAFEQQTFMDPEFDPGTYLLAVDKSTGCYAGLVRVWNKPGRARLGLIGVLPAYRRQGCARALIAEAFGVLHQRGRAEVSCEVDETNIASNALILGLGARRVGGSVELLRSGTRA